MSLNYFTTVLETSDKMKSTIEELRNEIKEELKTHYSWKYEYNSKKDPQ